MTQTFENFLKLINITEEELSDEMNSSPILSWNKDVAIKNSPIEGVGCFAQKEYSTNEEIGIVKYKDSRTTLGRFVNHSSSPNVYLEGNKFLALKKIKPNDEILVNYFSNLKTLLMEEQAKTKEEDPKNTEFDKFLERLAEIEVPERQCNIDEEEECVSCGS